MPAKILFLSQLLPYPPDAGAKVRSYYVLRHLATRFQVTLIAFVRPGDDLQGVAHLRSFCEAVYTVPMRRSLVREVLALSRSFLTSEPFVICRDWVPEMDSRVRQVLRSGQFQAIHADQLWMAQYVQAALRGNASPVPLRTILDQHNACYLIFERLAAGQKNPFKRWFLQREAALLKTYEQHVCARFDKVVTVTHEDRQILTSLEPSGSSAQYSTVPICVDTASIQPAHPAPLSKNLLHIGTMFWLPNIEGISWFINQVWPIVIAQCPQSSLTIVGKNPPPEILAAMQGQNVGSSPIQVTGYVHDLQPYLDQAAVFLVPLLSGGGMRVKIVDAWRWGLPVVSTSVGAEGIEYQDGENILIADTPIAYAQAVLRILKDQALARRLRQNGRRWVEEKYDWQRVYPAWDTVYDFLA